MILQALHTTLNPILPAHVLIGDIEAELPFCVFRADASPARQKAGVCGYEYVVNVGIIDNEVKSVNNYSVQIINAIQNMNGSVSGTDVIAAIQTDESGIYYENENNVFMNDIEFKVFTKNR